MKRPIALAVFSNPQGTADSIHDASTELHSAGGRCPNEYIVVECSPFVAIYSRFREVPMWRRPYRTILFFVISSLLLLPLKAQQKPFTQEQVVSMVRAGLGDDSGAKLIEQRGIDFAPSEDFYQTLKAAGASEAFLNALRAAKPPEPASAKKPINQVQVFAQPR